jgi:hypothetical protein
VKIAYKNKTNFYDKTLEKQAVIANVFYQNKCILGQTAFLSCSISTFLSLLSLSLFLSISQNYTNTDMQAYSN